MHEKVCIHLAKQAKDCLKNKTHGQNLAAIEKRCGFMS
jgi:hypothetical protein